MRSTRIPALLIITCGILALAAGCVPRTKHPDVVVVRETRNPSIANILSYASNVLTMPPEAQTAARDSLAQQFRLTQFPEDRMRLALLDTLLPEPARNDSEASSLLTGYNWTPEGPGFKGLAGTLLQILNDRKVQSQEHAKLEQQRTQLAQQLTAERAEKMHLQKQLEALERIEKTVNSRVSTTAPVPAGTHVSVPTRRRLHTSPPPATTHPPLPAAAKQGT